MHYIVVAGILGKRRFTSILAVADYLEKEYPYLIIHRIFVKPQTWKEWLNSLTKKNAWNHFTLPIAWKEVPFRGGKQCLIGGYQNFMEYCSEFYHVELKAPRKIIKYMGFQMSVKEIQNQEILKLHTMLPRWMCIYGAGSELVPLILPWLLKTPGFATNSGLMLGLYEENISKKEGLVGIVEEFGCILPQESCNGCFTAHIINNLKSSIKKCDILLVIIPEMCDFRDQKCWSDSVMYAAKVGNAIASAAKGSIRVILVSESHDTPICLCAAAFTDAASPYIEPHNVVAVTAGVGIMIRSILAYSLQVPLHNVEDVPVWGFTGISRILDPSLIPDQNDGKEGDWPTIAKEYHSNSAFKSEFLQTYIWPLFDRRMETMQISLRKKPCWIQVEALQEIFHKWYSNEAKKQTAYIGIYSNGTFGIRPGIFFSQPATLVNGIWRPNNEHPLPNDQFCKVRDLIRTAVLISDIYLLKDKHKYELTGLKVESNLDFFTYTDGHIELENANFVKNASQELLSKSLLDRQLEKLIPCIFPIKNYDYFVVELTKELMEQVLNVIGSAHLIPCIIPAIDNILLGMYDDQEKWRNLDFIIEVMKETMNKTLIDMKSEELFPYIFSLMDEIMHRSYGNSFELKNKQFITELIKGMMSELLIAMESEEIIPCILVVMDEIFLRNYRDNVKMNNKQFIINLVKEVMSELLIAMKSEEIIPCILVVMDEIFLRNYRDNVKMNNKQFIINLVKGVMSELLIAMKSEEIIPCILAILDETFLRNHIDNVKMNTEQFIADLMKEVMSELLIAMKSEEIIPCILAILDETLLRNHIDNVKMNTEQFIADLMKEVMTQVLIEMNMEYLGSCIFPLLNNTTVNFNYTDWDEYDMITEEMKKIMYKVLMRLKVEELVPYLLPIIDETRTKYINQKNNTLMMELIEESMSKILNEMGLEKLIPCLFYHEEK